MRSFEVSNAQTTTVDIVIRLQVAGSRAEVATYFGPLRCLAAVMASQAEDGLWSLGAPDAETDDGNSHLVADIERVHPQAVIIDGLPPIERV